jgi:membrane protein DedA with SNARE-associated domain/rhodanese-related sulfurtransferase
VDALVQLLVQHGLLSVFVFTLASRLGSPFPAAPLLIVAGSLAVTGELSVIPCIAVSLGGNLGGDAVWFWSGRRWGHRVLKFLCRVSITPDSCVRQSEGFITRWGGGALIAAKFVPGVSVVAAPMAGALGMPAWQFLAFSLLSGLIWTLTFMGLGALFYGQMRWLLEEIARGSTLVGAALGGALAAALLIRFARRRRLLLETSMERITVEELLRLMNSQAPHLVIDVRSAAAEQIDPRKIPGALRTDLAGVRALANNLPRDREIVVYCNCPNEVSAARAVAILFVAGVTRARPLAGGLEAWSSFDGRGKGDGADQGASVVRNPSAL